MSVRDRTTPFLFATASVAAATLLLGCGHHADRTATADPASAHQDSTASAGGTVASTPAPDPSSNAEPDVTAATLTTADVDLYQRSLVARMAMVKDMKDREAQAKNAVDSLRAMNSTSGDVADSTVARQAGVTARHVENVFHTLGDILVTMQGQGMTKDIGTQMDTLHMAPDARAQARAVIAQVHAESDSQIVAATAGMAPAVRTALEQRRPTLDSLRAELLKSAFGGR